MQSAVPDVANLDTEPAHMGIHHEHLTFRHSGRDQRLTDVHGKVIAELLG